jgi:hypothetical protein
LTTTPVNATVRQTGALTGDRGWGVKLSAIDDLFGQNRNVVLLMR